MTAPDSVPQASPAPHTSDPIASRATVCLSLSVALLFEVIGLTAYGYYRVTTALAPENLVDRVETAIEENYPNLRQQLVQHVHQNLPELADDVNQQLVSALPAGRQQLNQLAAQQIDNGLNEITELSAEQFQQFLVEHRSQVERILVAIENAPQQTREAALNIENELEELFGLEVQTQAQMALRVHRQLNDKLERLTRTGTSLTPAEQLELQIVRVLRAMQQDQSPPSVSARRPPSTLNQVATVTGRTALVAETIR